MDNEVAIKQMLVLIADDTKENLLLLSNILKTMELEVLLATDGCKVFEIVKINPPDLIILDIMMPEMDGFEICKQLKSNPETASIPIIFISALSALSSKVKAFKEGGVDYITKPFDNEEVRARVRTHLLIRRQQEYLKAMSREKDKILSILAHDLRGSIGSLRSILDLVMDSVDELSPDNRQIMKMFSKSIGVTYSLLDNLLLWAMAQQGRIAYFPKINNIDYIILDLINLFKPAADLKNIEFEYSFAQQSEAWFDPNLIATVLRNIIGNALKFTHIGGSISISTENSETELTVSIRDTGVGIGPEKLEKLFIPGLSISSPGTQAEKGTGLGLLLCKELVEKNQGRIWAASQPEKGTTFSFTLPIQIGEIPEEQ
jgi:two-component system, sensor histidine kinase and response regulator